jgi:hypothetical protein
LLGDRREDRALHADHRADEGVDHDEQRELTEVLAQAEAHRTHAGAPRAALVDAREDLLHRRGLGRDVGERVDEGVARLRQQRVPALLERDGARRLAAHPRAAGRAREVAG